MTVMPRNRAAASLGVGVLLALAPAGPIGSAASQGTKNYSMNSVNGEYAPPTPTTPAKNYSMNSVNGEYAPAASSQRVISLETRTDGFAWDDAAAGGGAAALIVVAAMGVRIGIRRRRLVAG